MSKYGNCHICGKYCKLSFEHVPPEKAFNFIRTQEYEVLPSLIEGKNIKKGKLRQKGVGSNTLCSDCNNKTGRLYAPEYIKWAKILTEKIRNNNLSDNRIIGKPKTIDILLRDVYPLRFFKQIITMFCSRNGENFQQTHPDLKNYLLEKDSQSLPHDFSIFMYLTPNNHLFTTGITGLIENGRNYLLSEFNHFPFGFCMFIGNVLDSPLTDITYYNEYSFNEKVDICINLSIISRNIPIPFDYRTKYEISYDTLINSLKKPYSDSKLQ